MKELSISDYREDIRDDLNGIEAIVSRGLDGMRNMTKEEIELDYAWILVFCQDLRKRTGAVK